MEAKGSLKLRIKDCPSLATTAERNSGGVESPSSSDGVGEGGVGAGAITIDLETVAMKSEQQCEEAGEKIFYSKNLDAPNNVHHARMIQNIRYICVEGK